MAVTSFSFQELQAAEKVLLAAPDKLTASDGITLAYRRYAPVAPRAAVLFFHGGGAHSGAGYQYVGRGLQTIFDAVVYTPDIRGHGSSGGTRGDAPNPDQVWDDITTILRHIRAEFPRLPLFLGGHSSGAGLVLNYSSQRNREPVDGYLFLSPQLGSRARIDRPSIPAPFVSVDGDAFAAYAMSGGAAHGHDFAVRFNYPTSVLEADAGLVPAITVCMSHALIPTAPHEQFAALDRPFGLWIGEEDELFSPERLLAFADLATSVRNRSEARCIPNAKHLSVLNMAHEPIGMWIKRSLNTADNSSHQR
jgi:alpha-beta hydrolase superfamily lysophospholipase